MSPQVCAILSALIEERIGLHYGPREHDFLCDRVAARAGEAGFDSLLDYYYHLRYDDPAGEELARLTDALVVNETFFFRERDQIERIIEDSLAPLVQRGAKVRIWSAACSTGEEPFTMAMLLAERGLLHPDRVEIVATDISKRALLRAQAGTFGPRSLRDGHPAAVAAKYLDRAGPEITLAAPIRAAVRFQHLNLLDRAAAAALGRFDLVLCRNVLIYFRDAAARQVIDHVCSAPRPDGVLLVGVSESLMRLGTALVCEERGGSFFY